MSQLPLYFGPRKANIKNRNAHALALWRARDGLLTPVTENTPITFTGGTSDRRKAKDATGALVNVGAHVPTAAMWDLDGDGVLEQPALRLSSPDSNRCTYSEDFTNWAATNSPAILAPVLNVGQTVLSLLEDNSASLQEFYQSATVSSTGLDARSVLSFFIARGNVNAAGGSGATLFDSTASAIRVQVTWTWAQQSSGVWKPTLTVTTGQLCSLEYHGRWTYLHQTTKLLTTTDVWRVSVRTATTFVNTNTNVVRVYPAWTAAQQGNEFFGGVMVSKYPTGYVKTTTTAGLDGGPEYWRMAFSGAPQAMTLAVRLIYTGSTLCYVSGTGGMVCTISDASLALPRLLLANSDNAGGTTYWAQIADGVNPALSVAHSVTPSPGDDVLLRVALRADGSLVLGQSLNGGAEVTATSGNPYGLPGAWAANSALRLVEGANGSEVYLGVGVFAGEPSAQYLSDILS